MKGLVPPALALFQRGIIMRMTRSSVTFNNPFKLDGFDVTLPPGTYAISTLEEETDTMLSQGWRRVSTSFCTPSIENSGGSEQWSSVSASNLKAALEKDGAYVFPQVQQA
jgi:hypothetical protein